MFCDEVICLGSPAAPVPHTMADVADVVLDELICCFLGGDVLAVFTMQVVNSKSFGK